MQKLDISKLGESKLEQLIDRIADPFLRAEQGFKYFGSNGFGKQLAKYSLLYLETLINYKEKHDDFSNDSFLGVSEVDYYSKNNISLHKISLLFNKITKNKAKKLGEKYIQERFSSLMKKEINSENDNISLHLTSLAKEIGIEEKTKEYANNYFNWRLHKVRNSYSITQLDIGYLFKIADAFSLSNGILTELYLATHFFTYKHFSLSDADKLPKINSENESQAVENAWQIAQNIWFDKPIDKNYDSKNESVIKSAEKSIGLSQLIENNIFQKRYSKDKTAQSIAKAVVINYLRNENCLKDEQMEQIKQLSLVYGIQFKKEDLHELVIYLFVEGRYNCLDNLKTEYSYEVTNREYKTAKKMIETKIETAIAEAKIDLAIKLSLQLNNFKEYRKNLKE